MQLSMYELNVTQFLTKKYDDIEFCLLEFTVVQLCSLLIKNQRARGIPYHYLKINTWVKIIKLLSASAANEINSNTIKFVCQHFFENFLKFFLKCFFEVFGLLQSAQNLFVF